MGESKRMTMTLTIWARIFLALFVVVALSGLAGLVDPAGQAASWPSLCLFHNLTGLDCPGCGMGRALACLASGRFRDAAGLNPFVFPLFLFLVAAALISEKKINRALETRTGTVISLTVCALIFVWWILKLTGKG